MSALYAELPVARVAGDRIAARLWKLRSKYLVAALLIFIATLMLLPFFAAFFHSIKSQEESAALPPTFFPHSFSLRNYAKLWDYQAGLPVYLWNSAGTAFLTIALTLGLAVPAGYGLARYPIPAKEALFVFLLLSLIIPHQALLTPIFLMFAKLGLTNSILGLAILHTSIQLPFSLYLMRNAFEAVPKELEEAAVIDGCNSLQVLVRICLPVVTPAMVTVMLFAFITSWNDFLGALVLMSKGDAFTLPPILASSRSVSSLGGTDWGMLQAGVTISMLPCLAIYLLLQRYYFSGFLTGVVK